VPIGWPTDAQLAAKLGPHVDPADPNVTSANEAAAADATRFGTPAGTVDDTGALDAASFEAILAIGVWRYNSRNHGPDYSQGEYAVNLPERTRAIALLAGRRPTIA
jgi:hypothetical protein